VPGRFARPRLANALAFSLAFKALNVVVLTQVAAAVLSLCQRLWGRASVANLIWHRFSCHQVGFAALLAVASILLTSFYFEFSDLLRLLDVVQPIDISVEGLMDIYVSMGITAGQFFKVTEQPGNAYFWRSHQLRDQQTMQRAGSQSRPARFLGSLDS
jgi:hypothetical protein